MPLVAPIPVWCPRGHKLGLRLYYLGHRACACEAAIKGGKSGHTVARCRLCLDAGIDEPMLHPPCTGERLTTP